MSGASVASVGIMNIGIGLDSLENDGLVAAEHGLLEVNTAFTAVHDLYSCTQGGWWHANATIKFLTIPFLFL